MLNRGQSADRPLPAGVRELRADARDAGSVRAAVDGLDFDSVVDFVAFAPEHVQADIDLFTGRTGQYVFISTASAYQKPPSRLPITESTPLRNPYWQYSRDKIACEDLLVAQYRETGFPATIVRPSHTYDATKTVLSGGWTSLARMLAGQAGDRARRRDVAVDGDAQHRLRARVRAAARALADGGGGVPHHLRRRAHLGPDRPRARRRARRGAGDRARAVGCHRRRRPRVGGGAAGGQGVLGHVRQLEAAVGGARLARGGAVRAGGAGDRRLVPGASRLAGRRRAGSTR